LIKKLKKLLTKKPPDVPPKHMGSYCRHCGQRIILKRMPVFNFGSDWMHVSLTTPDHKLCLPPVRNIAEPIPDGCLFITEEDELVYTPEHGYTPLRFYEDIRTSIPPGTVWHCHYCKRPRPKAGQCPECGSFGGSSLPVPEGAIAIGDEQTC